MSPSGWFAAVCAKPDGTSGSTSLNALAKTRFVASLLHFQRLAFAAPGSRPSSPNPNTDLTRFASLA
jgi:hypothetical protein